MVRNVKILPRKGDYVVSGERLSQVPTQLSVGAKYADPHDE